MDELRRDRRTQRRFPVDVVATVLLLNQGKTFGGRMLDLSLEGCGLRLDDSPRLVAPFPVEVGFKINGLAFRLSGVLERAEDSLVAGVRFAPMVPRRRDAFIEVLQELEEKSSGACEAEAAPQPQGLQLITPMTPARRIDSLQPAQDTRPGLNLVNTPCLALKQRLSASEGARGPSPATAPNGRERREQTRHVVDSRVTILFIDVAARATGIILDLSKSGCRIRTDARFPVGIFRRIEMEFWLDGLPFRLGGVVQSLHDGYTVGIRFLDLSPRKREQLRELIEEIEAVQVTTPAPSIPQPSAE